ncbi:MAG: hypothetical protein EZS28_028305 [Streblomastix strix]|uniref:Uncharacterized protein n=1 Tax=Streblomastix strix TaxID=222440 RepID=A0A5J4V0B8_9EUKA|nr:MAG: hypothetical protein EZS28_028305 [Streblomastix strix]
MSSQYLSWQPYPLPYQLESLPLKIPRPLPLGSPLESYPFESLSISILVFLRPQQSSNFEQNLDPKRSLDSLLQSRESFLGLLLHGDKDLFLCLPNQFLNQCLVVLAGCNVSESYSESYSLPTHATFKSKLYSLQSTLTSSIEGAIPNRFDILQSVSCGTYGPYPGQYCPSSSLPTDISSNPFKIHLYTRALMVSFVITFEISGISCSVITSGGKIVVYNITAFHGVCIVHVLVEADLTILNLKVAYHQMFSQSEFPYFVREPGSHSSSAMVSLFVSRLLMVLTSKIFSF